MKIFIIQPEHKIEGFENFLSEGLSLPLNIIFKFYDGFSISVNQHYFNNFFNNFIKNKFPNKEEFIDYIEKGEEEVIQWLFNEYKIGIFIYNVLD